MIETSGEIFTVGHSTLAIEKFLAMLREHGIEALVDVRSFPGSRRHPQYNRERVAAALREAGFAYYHMVSLGGRRKTEEAASYADYTKTAPFRAGLAELETLALTSRAAIMCAEARWQQCHRRFIADELVRDGFKVHHILRPEEADEAKRSPELPGL